jgi:hypothetical protein
MRYLAIVLGVVFRMVLATSAADPQVFVRGYYGPHRTYAARHYRRRPEGNF